MQTSKNRISLIVSIVFLLTLLMLLGGKALARHDSPTIPEQNKQTVVEKDVREILLVMCSNDQGSVTKQQYMKLMSDQFDGFDVDKKGAVDANTALKSAPTYRSGGW